MPDKKITIYFKINSNISAKGLFALTIVIACVVSLAKVLQFVVGVDRGSLGNTRLLPRAKMLLVPINF